MLEIAHVCAGYRGTKVLSDVSLSLKSGEITVLIGPNGCGKSTLVRTAAGIIRPESGQVLIDGENIAALAPRELAQRVSYMAQSKSIPNITASQMVLHGRFPYLSYPRRYSRTDYEAVEHAMRETGTEKLAGCLMQEMSGGQRQKIYLAMMLAQDTPVVLMDEPTNFLDISNQLELLRISRRFAAEGKTVLMVMHELRLALQIADRAVLMENGRILAADTPEAVFESGLLAEVFGVGLRRIDTEDGAQYYYHEEKK